MYRIEFCPAVSDEGDLAVSCSADGTIKLWDVTDGRCVHTFDEAHLAEILALEVCNQFAVSGGDDCLVIFFAISFSCSFSFSSFRFRFSFSFPFLLLRFQKVKLWNLQTRTFEKSWHTDMSVAALRVHRDSPTGDPVLIGVLDHDDQITIFDVSQSEKIFHYACSSPLHSFAIINEGTCIVFCDKAGLQVL